MGPLSSIPESACEELPEDLPTHLGPGLEVKTSGRTEKQNDTEQSKDESAELAECLPELLQAERSLSQGHVQGTGALGAF